MNFVYKCNNIKATRDKVKYKSLFIKVAPRHISYTYVGLYLMISLEAKIWNISIPPRYAGGNNESADKGKAFKSITSATLN